MMPYFEKEVLTYISGMVKALFDFLVEILTSTLYHLPQNKDKITFSIAR